MKNSSQQTEDHVKQLVFAHLRQHGLPLKQANFLCQLGKIHLVMRDNDDLISVEVRSRHNENDASAIESVAYFKQQKIIKTAQFYLQQHRLTDKVACRFDVVAVNLKNNHPNIHWLKNAF